MKKLLSFFALTLCVILSLGCSEKSPRGTIYLLNTYENSAGDSLGIPTYVYEENQYQNMEAEPKRTLSWESYTWELTYSHSRTVMYLESDLDIYTNDLGEGQVAYKAGTDQLMGVAGLPVDINLEGMTQTEFDELIDSFMESLVFLSPEGLEKNIYSYRLLYEIDETGDVSADHRYVDGFYLPGENEEITRYGVIYSEKIEDIHTLKHIKLHIRSSGSIFLEIYDMDTSGLKVALQDAAEMVQDDFSYFISAGLEEIGCEPQNIETHNLEAYEKDGKIYIIFYGVVDYLGEKGAEQISSGQYILEYPKPS